MSYARSTFLSHIAVAWFVALSLGVAPAQEQPPFVVRIVELTSTGFMCTALTPDHQLEQLTMAAHQFKFGSPELRRGPATDEDVKRVDELLQQPEIRNAGNTVSRFPMMAGRDGKAILVVGSIEGKIRVVHFNDAEGKKSPPLYLKGFEAFSEDVRRRKLPKSSENKTANCNVPAH